MKLGILTALLCILAFQVVTFSRPAGGPSINTGPIKDDVGMVFSRYVEEVDRVYPLATANAKVQNMEDFWIFYMNEGLGSYVSTRDWRKKMLPILDEHDNLVQADPNLHEIERAVYLARSDALRKP